MQVKVWNDNDYDLKEIFKGDPVEIKAHTYREMEFYEAHEFKGQYHPRPVDNNGKLIDDPKYNKIIRIEKIIEGDEDETPATGHVCMSCKKSYESEPVLTAHIATAHASQERLSLPEEDTRIERKKKQKAS